MSDEKSVIKLLDKFFNKKAKYKLSNSYIFNWESDFFILKRDGYAHEYEIKISRTDFLADSKKIRKHSILNENSENVLKPNKFFYVVPENLITLSEIPEYVGLYYIRNNWLYKIKEAPFIHRNKDNYESILCSKFYFKWLNCKKN